MPAGNPVSPATTISSTVHNNTMSDIATALTGSLTKNGEAVASANQPMGGYKHTNVAVAAAQTDYARASQVQNGSIVYLTSVSGTNTITATGAISMAAYATGMALEFIPAATNTGATTINVNSIGAKSIFYGGAALVGGELTINVPARIVYDGTQFHLTDVVLNTLTADTAPDKAADYVMTYDASASGHKKVLLGAAGSGTLGTEQATTSGTEKDFTIPSWAKKITVMLVGVSVSGTSSLLVQIGDAGGIETSGYLGASSLQLHTAANTVQAYTTGFGIFTSAATNVVHGALVLTLENAAAFTWIANGDFARSDVAGVISSGGSKSLSAALTTVRLTTVNGTDTFDAGAANVLYE